MTAILENLTQFSHMILNTMGNVVTAITDNPLLLMFTLVPLVGIGIGFFKRLLNVN